eukprot:scaffold1869_cov163-Ochromonas_danica.AAC.32
MFNFIFDGKLGDILAPVVPSNQLFLAIQHHKNGEIISLLQSTSYDPNQLTTSGYSAIHVACRYNNKYALDVLLSRGASLNLEDKSGDTPLHYAAKYGNLDICKYLIEKGASAHVRNKANQTSYDVAESHLVRQYLLPLVLQAERTHGVVATPDYNPYGSVIAGGGIPYQPQHAAPLISSLHTPPPLPIQQSTIPPPPMVPIAPAAAVGQTALYQYPNAPPPVVSVASGPFVPPPPAPVETPVLPPSLPPAPSAPSVVGFMPDGFHSSASDPLLQQKYGHVMERPNLAPPPTSFSFPPPSAVSPPAVTTAYQRYVPYDPHTQSAAPVPNAIYPPAPTAVYSSAPALPPVQAFPPPGQAFPPAPLPQSTLAPPPSAIVPPAQHPAMYARHPSGISVQVPPSTIAPPSSAPATTQLSPNKPIDRLLGNKTLSTDDILQAKSPSAQPSAMINVFNPNTDTTVVVNAQSTSSAIL